MSDFAKLPEFLRRQIDAAFDHPREHPSGSNRDSINLPAAKRRRLNGDNGSPKNQTEVPLVARPDAGGFLLDDDNYAQTSRGPSPGRPAPSLKGTTTESLPLSLIPAALQYLDLPPDDEDILSALKSAAGGWGVLVEGEQGVNRTDWREVCAVLLENRIPTDDEDESVTSQVPEEAGGFVPEDDGTIEMDEGGFVKGSVRRVRGAPAATVQVDDHDEEEGGFLMDDADEENEDLDLDALVESDLGDNSEDEYDDAQNEEESGFGSVQASSGDEYNDVTTRSGRKITTKGRSGTAPSHTPVGSKVAAKRRRDQGQSSSSPPPRPGITPRQKTEARKAFALFFPGIEDLDPKGKGKGKAADGSLDTQRIKIKDIARVAGELSIKIKTEEIVEMLEAFSSNPDKSVSLADFEKIVMAARLV